MPTPHAIVKGIQEVRPKAQQDLVVLRDLLLQELDPPLLTPQTLCNVLNVRQMAVHLLDVPLGEQCHELHVNRPLLAHL